MLLRAFRHLRPNQEDNFGIISSDSIANLWQRLTAAIAATAVGIVSVFMVVGGIVIMNIMLMVVTERTREIGLRKALGAKRRDIMAQFLVESATLATVGAIIGILLGVLVAKAISSATPLPTTVAPWSVVAAVVLGAGVGIVSGAYPASRASRLDPITALRQE
jgi:putative ABC transport system permease protein